MKVGVWGAGKEGVSAARQLLSSGFDVVVVDEMVGRVPPELPSEVLFASGPNALNLLRDCEKVICSPGVPRTHPFRNQLREELVTTLTAMWMAEFGASTVGVTGTKGKSTTSTLISLLIAETSRSVQLGGNIGIPLGDLHSGVDTTVAELSSYQCAYLQSAPRLAVITSLYDDHLPWHGSRRQYWLDKAKILGSGCTALVCDSETLAKLNSLSVVLPERVLQPNDALRDRLSGIELGASLSLSQNRRNFELALVAAEYWVGRHMRSDEIAHAVNKFQPLPHRLEIVPTEDGIVWIDDTLSTVPESVAAALESITGEVVLILGGEDRGLDYAVLERYLSNRAPRPHLIAIPTNGGRIVAGYRSIHPNLVHDAPSVEAAVKLAKQIASPGFTVLLSPGAPSYDHHTSFEHKSAKFLNAIHGRKTRQV